MLVSLDLLFSLLPSWPSLPVPYKTGFQSLTWLHKNEIKQIKTFQSLWVSISLRKAVKNNMKRCEFRLKAVNCLKLKKPTLCLTLKYPMQISCDHQQNKTLISLFILKCNGDEVELLCDVLLDLMFSSVFNLRRLQRSFCTNSI